MGASLNHIQLPKIAGDPLKAGGSSFAAEALSISVKDASSLARSRARLCRPSARSDRPLALATEAKRRRDRGRFEVIERIELGPRLPLTGDADMEAIGNALHAVFAADDGEDDMALRLQRAKSILSRWKTFQVQAADVIAAADRLRRISASAGPAARSFARRRFPRGSTASS